MEWAAFQTGKLPQRNRMLLLIFYFFLETGFHYVAFVGLPLAGLELIGIFCLPLPP